PCGRSGAAHYRKPPDRGSGRTWIWLRVLRSPGRSSPRRESPTARRARRKPRPGRRLRRRRGDAARDGLAAAQRGQGVVTCHLAAPADLGTDPAVLVVAGMAVALFGA